MKYKVVQKEAFRVAGLMNEYPLVNGGEDFDRISEKWGNLSQEQMQMILNFANGNVQGFLGISSEQNQTTFQYTIGLTTNEEQAVGLQIIEIPAATWLIFESHGAIPQAMMALKEETLKKWLPHSNYQPADIPRIEIYPQGEMDSEDYRSELWIPVLDDELIN